MQLRFSKYKLSVGTFWKSQSAQFASWNAIFCKPCKQCCCASDQTCSSDGRMGWLKYVEVFFRNLLTLVLQSADQPVILLKASYYGVC